MDFKKKISRKQFLVVMGSGMAAFAVTRLAGMIESTTASNVAVLKDIDSTTYGSTAYGGRS